MTKHFTKLDGLPCYDLYAEFTRMVEAGIIDWKKDKSNQIGLNTIASDPDNIYRANGSLIYDWENTYTEVDSAGTERTIVPKFEKPYEETDFDTLCTQFHGTLFEEVYNAVKEKYDVGRVRLMRSHIKTCLSWHVDTTPRIHYPLKTQQGCLMIIDDEVLHMPAGEWWYTNTLLPHTALNASKEDRIHLVFTVLAVK